MKLWNVYHHAFESAEREGRLRRPVVPAHCQHNAHLYYLLLPTRRMRDHFISAMVKKGVRCVFHYVPLHDSPAGKRFGRSSGKLKLTEELSGRLVRLPLWLGMDVGRVIESALDSL
jgi:dTDP-4-amino-4,6-dideoxygalactose transaminase